MLKLTIEHLAPYLPYGLKFDNGMILSGIDKSGKLAFDSNENIYVNYSYIQYVKPLLNPLSEYTDINGQAMGKLNIDITDQVQINEIANGRLKYLLTYYDVALICFKNHIDIFNLIDKGLAVKK